MYFGIKFEMMPIVECWQYLKWSIEYMI
jgi:hypothetical protein